MTNTWLTAHQMSTARNSQKHEITIRSHFSNSISLNEPISQGLSPVTFLPSPFHIQRPSLIPICITYEIPITNINQNSNSAMKQFGNVRLGWVEHISCINEGGIDIPVDNAEIPRGGIDTKAFAYGFVVQVGSSPSNKIISV